MDSSVFKNFLTCLHQIQNQLREDTGLFLTQVKERYVQWIRCPLLGLVEERDVSIRKVGELREEDSLKEIPTSQGQPDQCIRVRYIRNSWSSKRLAFFFQKMARQCCAAELGLNVTCFPWERLVWMGMWRNSREEKELAGTEDLHKTCLHITAVQPLISSRTVETFCAIHLRK